MLVVGSAFLASTVYAQTIAITGGRVFPVSAPPMDNGTVVMDWVLVLVSR